MPRPVILFHSPRSLPSWPAALQAAFPDHEVRLDLAGVDPGAVVAAIVWNHPFGLLAPLRGLALIQLLGAGVDHILADPALPDVPIARLVDDGLTGTMSAYVALHALALHRREPELRRAQSERAWRYVHPRATRETCVGIMGLGVLGRACAETLAGLGFTLVGWSRSAKTGLPFETFDGQRGLRAFQARVACYVLLLPLTPDTESIVDARFLAHVSPGATLVNVGRGGLVDEAALIAALDAGRLRHAVLDVFRHEPLAPDHPFWTHPAVTVTPHCSGGTSPDSALAKVVANVRRALAGETPENMVDRRRGY